MSHILYTRQDSRIDDYDDEEDRLNSVIIQDIIQEEKFKLPIEQKNLEPEVGESAKSRKNRENYDLKRSLEKGAASLESETRMSGESTVQESEKSASSVQEPGEASIH